MELKFGQMVALREGSRIYPLTDSAYYFEVTAIDNAGLTLKDSRTGQERTTDDSFTIGRGLTNQIILYESDASRAHGIIEWDEINPETQEEGFRYRHNGRFSTKVESATLIEGDVNVETVAHRGNSKPGEESVQGQVFVLEPGTRIHFRYDIPEYVVGILGDSITLTRQSENDRYPAEINANRNTDTSITRSMLGNHFGISRKQAIIAWDEDTGQFAMINVGQARITSSPGSGFIVEQVRINKNLELPLDIAQAQLLTANALKVELNEDLEKALSLMKGLQNLELATIVTPLSDMFEGAHTEDSQRGYEIWLRAYQILYADKLDSEEKAKLDKMIRVVHELGEDRSAIRKIEKSYPMMIHGIPKYETGNTGSYFYAKEMSAFTARKLEELKQHGEVYLPTGFHGHHTVSRIWKNNDGNYILTTCNAGGEHKSAPVQEDPSGELVMVSYDQKIKISRKGSPEIDLKELITLLAEKKLRYVAYHGDPQGYGALCGDIESKLDVVGMHRNGKPQGKGNCTTRSTREALYDVLGEKLFASIHSHVSDPNNSNAHQILEALDIRIQALERITQKRPPQSSVGDSVDLEIARSLRDGRNL